jgi:uncharacterized coiled-coil protein SlyX
MEQQQGMTQEEFVRGQTIDNLARANAQQAVQIANLQANIAMLQQMLDQAQKQGAEAPKEPEQTFIPGEKPLEASDNEDEQKH